MSWSPLSQGWDKLGAGDPWKTRLQVLEQGKPKGSFLGLTNDRNFPESAN